ncbi:unnamed protein product [Toxocara canis]|uniref:HOOK_N domain-containing protein n=1 Tax=Toxocara canis TaxID=6265 RepID=A0A183VF71_TOXCA|nr:unnamed protein product [Toxocara canis]
MRALEVQTPVTRDTLYVGRCIAEALHKMDRLSKELGPEWIVDPSRIADHNGEEVLSRLLQLVLGAALLSKSNEVFVPALLNQPESVQITAMEVVQKLSNVVPNTATTPDQALPAKSVEQMAALSADIEHLRAERDRLTKELKETRDEMEQMTTENEALKHRVDEFSTTSTEMETLKKQLRLVQLSRDTAQESLYKLA